MKLWHCGTVACVTTSASSGRCIDATISHRSSEVTLTPPVNVDEVDAEIVVVAGSAAMHGPYTEQRAPNPKCVPAKLLSQSQIKNLAGTDLKIWKPSPESQKPRAKIRPVGRMRVRICGPRSAAPRPPRGSGHGDGALRESISSDRELVFASPDEPRVIHEGFPHRQPKCGRPSMGFRAMTCSCPSMVRPACHVHWMWVQGY